MNAKLKTIIKNLPAKKSRSRLEPYRELIREMRRTSRSYREIVQVLRKECDLQVSVSTLHDFVRLRSKISQRTTPANRGLSVSNKARKEQEGSISAYKRIQALPNNGLTKRTPFHYDPDGPLRLMSQQPEKKNRP